MSVCFWELKNKISNDKLYNKVFKTLKFWKFTMDLSEKGKCLFTSLQYVESSQGACALDFFALNMSHEPEKTKNLSSY
jgi:hypothetical protein